MAILYLNHAPGKGEKEDDDHAPYNSLYRDSMSITPQYRLQRRARLGCVTFTLNICTSWEFRKW